MTPKEKAQGKEAKTNKPGAGNKGNAINIGEPAVTQTADLPENIYQIRKWGDPLMLKLGYDVKRAKTSNFQALGLYNKETGFGAITNFIHILRDDIENLRDMQFDEIVNGEKFTKDSKMDWLCAHRGRIYMTDKESDNWRTAKRIRWGTLALGGNRVQVTGSEIMKMKLPGAIKDDYRMWKVAGFRKTDWSRPLEELLAEGLVHRCYCAYKDNRFGDSPKGIVYSPFYSPLDWDFSGPKKPDALYIPDLYLEPKPA